MRLPSDKVRATVLLGIIPILSFFNSCVTATPPASITEPKPKPITAYNTEKLNIHFIKMKLFGDAILIDLKETEVLIDGGWPNSGVATYIKKYVDGPLEAMVISHPHFDHLGGLSEVLVKFQVNQIWVNGDLPDEYDPKGYQDLVRYRKIESLAIAKGTPIYVARRGQTIDIDALSFNVLHPDKLITNKKDYPSMNKNSIVLRLTYGSISFLFTGDAPKETENEILRAGLEVQADILKVGHHASDRSCSDKFMKSAKPKVAIYMAGEKQPAYGPKKPHPKTIAKLKKVGAKVYGTTTGSIVVTTDGKTYTVGYKNKHYF